MGAQPQDSLLRQYLIFSFAGQEYAVGILEVREVVERRTITRVHAMPPWIKGVLNLRGAVVPVVDLALKFGLPETGMTSRSCILVMDADLDGERTAIGVIADSVSRVLELGPGNVSDAEASPAGVGARYLAGVGRVDSRIVPILDIGKVLTQDELLGAGAVLA